MRWNEQRLDAVTQCLSGIGLLAYVLFLFAVGLLETVQGLICDLQMRMLNLRAAECFEVKRLIGQTDLLGVFLLLLIPTLLVHGFVIWHREHKRA